MNIVNMVNHGEHFRVLDIPQVLTSNEKNNEYEVHNYNISAVKPHKIRNL